MTLVRDGVILASVSEGGPRRHAEDLGVQVTEVVRDAGLGDRPIPSLGLDSVCVGRGPGSFTAVRAGLAFARAFARGLSVPAFGISSFDSFALNAFAAHPYLEEVTVVTDARRREVFWGSYRLSGGKTLQRVAPLAVGPLSEVAVRGALVLDPKLEVPTDIGAHEILTVDSSSAGFAQLLVEAQETEQGAAAVMMLDPIYLRRPDVSPPRK